MDLCVLFQCFWHTGRILCNFHFFLNYSWRENIFSNITWFYFIFYFLGGGSSLSLKENQIYAFTISWIVYLCQRLVFRFPRKSIETHFIIHISCLVSLFILTVVFIIFLLALSLLLQQCDRHWFSLLLPPLTQTVFLCLLSVCTF